MKTTKVMWVLTLLLALSQPITAQPDMRPVRPVSLSQTDQWDRLQKSHEVSPALMRPRGYHEFTPLSSLDEKVIPQPFELPDPDPIPDIEVSDGKMPTVIYGMLVYSSDWPNQNGKGRFGVYSFEANETTTVNAVAKNDIFNANGGGVYANGKYNFINYSLWGGMIVTSYDYYQYDTYDWKQTQHISGTETKLMMVDGDYDPATGRVYGLMYTDDLQKQVFGVVDYSTNSRQVIKELNENFVAMAITPEGVVYAVRNDGAFVMFDKTNGEYTVIGETGIVPQFMQSAAVDPKTGKFFWAAVTNVGTAGLYEVSFETGKATLVKRFEHNEEFTGLFIPAPLAEEDAPAAPTAFNVNFTRGSLSGQVRFRMPTTTYAGDKIEDEELLYEVFIDDEIVLYDYAAPGATVTDSLTVPHSGNYTFYVCANNFFGNGPKVRQIKYVGDDAPKAPGTVVLRNGTEENEILLSWLAPTAGINGGYVNTANLNYTVVRYPEQVTVAEGLKERRFSEVLAPAQLTNYWYEVIAFNDTIRGESAFSNHRAYGVAKEIPYSEDFEDQSVVANMFTIIDANKDGSTWKAGNWNNGERNVYYEFNERNAADDWIITPPLHLLTGHFYHLSFNANCGLIGKEKMSVSMGTDKTAAAMTQLLIPTTEIENYEKAAYKGIFQVEEEGLYYIGFHAESDADEYDLDLDDILVTEGGLFTAPDTVANLTVIPGANGVKIVDFTFNVPTTDFNGDPIDCVDSIAIYRGVRCVKVFENPELGAELTFRDTYVPNGMNTYSIYTYNANGNGIPAQRSVWVGVDIPTEPVDLRLVDRGSFVQLSWGAPKTGVHGGYVNPAALTYNIEDENYRIVGDHRSGTSYTEAVNAEKQTVKYYRVSAQSAAGGGNYAYSNSVIVGNPYTLPFFESFPNAKTPEQFWTQQSTGGEMGLTNGISADYDQGSAIYKPEKAGDRGMFTSGKISLKRAEHPVLEFYYYAVPGQGTSLAVGVVPDGDTDNLKLVHTINYSSLSGNPGWRKVVVDLSEFTNTSYILLTFIGTALNSNVGDIAFDAITVRNRHNIDLSLSLDMSEYIVVGNELTADVKLENVGALLTRDHVVQFFKNGELVEEQRGNSIYSGAKQVFTFNVPVSAADPDDNVFEARVVVEGDGDESNNSMKKNVKIEKLKFPTVAQLTTQESDASVVLSWQAPDLSAGEVRYTDGFDRYSPFIIRHIGSWTTVDVDGAETLAMMSGDATIVYDHVTQPMAFQVFNSAKLGMSGSAISPHSGDQMLMNIIENNAAADDWLISPVLSGKAQTISFWVKSVDAGTQESFEVLASANGKDVTDFTSVAASMNTAPAEWTEVTASLPDGTKYFAIRVSGRQKFMLMLDDVTYTLFDTSDLHILGYNVYKDGVLVNDTPLTATSYVVPAQADGNYQVSVVYDLGESSPSDPCTVTGIAQKKVGSSIFVSDRTIVVSAPEVSDISVVTADGRTVCRKAEATQASVTVVPGVYVVTVGDRRMKVNVK